MMPGLGFLVATLLAGAFAAGVAGLVRELRGVVDPACPPGPGARLAVALRSPALTGRLAAAVVVGLGVLVVTRWPDAAAGLTGLVAGWPRLFGGGRAEQREIAKLEALTVWTESLRDTIEAHASLEQAIPATAGNAPVLIRPALVRLVGQMRARVPLERALLGLAAELDDASADLVIAALVLNVRRRGNRLAEVLGGLASTAREELDLRRRVAAGRAVLRRDVSVVVALTLVTAALLTVFAPDYTVAYGTPAGQAVLAVVVGIFAAGFAWLRHLSVQRPAAPFLARPGRPADPTEQTLVATLTATAEPGVRR
jgi:Flp pilus assembly protein TadB